MTIRDEWEFLRAEDIEAIDRMVTERLMEPISNTAAVTSNVTPMETISLQKMLEVVRQFEQRPEPFAEFMRNHGAPPEHGWQLVLPYTALRYGEVPQFIPPYVHYTKALDYPVLHNPSAGKLMKGVPYAPR